MVRLNLLPWRERQRIAALRRFQQVLVASLLAALLGLVWLDQLARQRVQQQLEAVAANQAEITHLDAELAGIASVVQAREAVLAQLAALAALRQDQALVPRLLAELEEAMGRGVHLTELSFKGGDLQLVGLAASSAVVAQLMRDLEQSPLLLALELKQIRALPEGDEFILLARLRAEPA